MFVFVCIRTTAVPVYSNINCYIETKIPMELALPHYVQLQVVVNFISNFNVHALSCMLMGYLNDKLITCSRIINRFLFKSNIYNIVYIRKPINSRIKSKTKQNERLIIYSRIDEIKGLPVSSSLFSILNKLENCVIGYFNHVHNSPIFEKLIPP